jgi:adenylosuccinate synthase
VKRSAIQIVDLGFGDSGKGAMVDYLAAQTQAEWIIRFNGGPQAGHNVVLPDGRRHTFAQFGSAAFLPGARTLLSRFMLIEPYAMLNEAEHLRALGVTDALSRTSIDERCLVITPPQQIANRLRERARGSSAHGTCGMGVGECVEDVMSHPNVSVHAGDLNHSRILRTKLRASLDLKHRQIREHLSMATPNERLVFADPSWIDRAVEVYEQVAHSAEIVPASRASEILRESACTIFEGAQGVLLDERFGFHPHTTWSKTTFTNADALLDEAGGDFDRQRVGVMRTYLTRHGNGPLVTKDSSLDRLAEPDNRDDGYAGRFRRGVLDLVMLRYAIRACGGIDALAVTHLDKLPHLPPTACDQYALGDEICEVSPINNLCDMEQMTERLKIAKPRYIEWPTGSPDEFTNAIGRALAVPVRYKSFGETRHQKAPI